MNCRSKKILRALWHRSIDKICNFQSFDCALGRTTLVRRGEYPGWLMSRRDLFNLILTMTEFYINDKLRIKLQNQTKTDNDFY